jgi:hypothetical protein
MNERKKMEHVVTENNFMTDIWKAVNLKEIPSLTSLTCSVIYFSLKQYQGLAVKSYTGKYPFDCLGNECWGDKTLWELIQHGLTDVPRLLPGFKIVFQKISQTDLESLGLPPILLHKYFSFPNTYHSMLLNYKLNFDKKHKKMRPATIMWAFPETQQSKSNRELSHQNIYRQKLANGNHQQFTCKARLDKLGCNCLSFFPERNIIFEEWEEQVKENPTWYDGMK